MFGAMAKRVCYGGRRSRRRRTDEASQRAIAALESALLARPVVPSLAPLENARTANGSFKPARLPDARDRHPPMTDVSLYGKTPSHRKASTAALPPKAEIGRRAPANPRTEIAPDPAMFTSGWAPATAGPERSLESKTTTCPAATP